MSENFAIFQKKMVSRKKYVDTAIQAMYDKYTQERLRKNRGECEGNVINGE